MVGCWWVLKINGWYDNKKIRYRGYLGMLEEMVFNYNIIVCVYGIEVWWC